MQYFTILYIGSASNGGSLGQLGWPSDLLILRKQLQQNQTFLKIIIIDPIYSILNGTLTEKLLLKAKEEMDQKTHEVDLIKFTDYLNLGFDVEIYSMLIHDWIKSKNISTQSTLLVIDNTGSISSYEMDFKNTPTCLCIASGCMSKSLNPVNILKSYNYDFKINIFPNNQSYDLNSGLKVPKNLYQGEYEYIIKRIDTLFSILRNLMNNTTLPEWVNAELMIICGTSDANYCRKAVITILTDFLNNNLNVNVELSQLDIVRKEFVRPGGYKEQFLQKNCLLI